MISFHHQMTIFDGFKSLSAGAIYKETFQVEDFQKFCPSTTNMLALTFVLSLAVLGQCQDQGLIQSFADPMANQYQRAPLFFNPITYTFYQTVRGISTSSTYCFTTSAGCAPIRKLNEDIVPSLVQR